MHPCPGVCSSLRSLTPPMSQPWDRPIPSTGLTLPPSSTQTPSPPPPPLPGWPGGTWSGGQAPSVPPVAQASNSLSPDPRICFPFLNSGRCERGALCKFRHLSQDHPEAIADRMRTGHHHKIPQQVQQAFQRSAQHPPPMPLMNGGTCASPHASQSEAPPQPQGLWR